MQNRSARAYWTLFITQTLSMIGSRMSGFAIGIFIYHQTGDATPLALIAFFETVPFLLLGNIGGMVADRFDRRKVLFVANVCQAIATLFLIWAFGSGDFQTWHVYLVAAINSAVNAFLTPAFIASLSQLIPDAQRDRMNALNEMAGPLAGVLAPGLASALYAPFGAQGVLLLDLFSFLIAAVGAVIIFLPRVEQSAAGKAAAGNPLRELAGGLSFLWGRKLLLGLILYFTAINFAFTMATVLVTPYVLARTNSDAALGAIASVMNVGAILGAVVMGVWGGTRPRIHTIMISVLVTASAIMVWGTSRSALVLGVASFIALFPLPMINAAIMSILQVKTPHDLQGRIFALVNQFSMALMPVAQLLIGPLADGLEKNAVGTPGWSAVAGLVGEGKGAGIGLIAVVAGGSILIMTLIVYALPKIRHMEAILPDYAPPQGEPDAVQAEQFVAV